MTPMNAIINLNGKPAMPVRISQTGSGVSILDVNGQAYNLPTNVTLDVSTMTLRQNGSVVGSITSESIANRASFLRDTTNELFASSSSNSSFSAGANPLGAQRVSSAAEITPDAIPDSDTAPVETVAEAPATGMRITATLPDGLWRPRKDTDGDGIPDDEDPTPNGEDVPGDGAGGGGGDTPIPEDEWHEDPFAGGGGGGGGGDTENTAGGEDTAGNEIDTTNNFDGHEMLPEPEALVSKLANSAFGKALPYIGGAASILSNLLKGKWGQAAGAVGIGALGISMYLSAQDFFRDPSPAKAAGLALQAFGFLTSFAPFVGGEFTKLFMFSSNPVGLIALAGIIAFAAITKNWGIPKDQAHDNKLDADKMPNTTRAAAAQATAAEAAGRADAWFNYLPSNAYKNVFYILPGVIGLGIGINLADNGPLTDTRTTYNVDAVHKQLQDATNMVVPGAGKNLPGKVFLKLGDGVNTPDKAVYVEETVNDGEYKVNMVTLNNGGYYVGDAPDAEMIAFFNADPNTGAIIPDERAAKAVGLMRAMAAAGVSPQASPTGAANAVHIGAAAGHESFRLDNPNAPQ